MAENATLFRRGHAFWWKGIPKVQVEIIAGLETILLDVGFDGTQTDEYNVDEATGTARSADWFVRSNDLVFDSGKKEPESGWQIKQSLPNGKVAVYDVLPERGDRAFDVMDRLGIYYRVHTKLNGHE